MWCGSIMNIITRIEQLESQTQTPETTEKSFKELHDRIAALESIMEDKLGFYIANSHVKNVKTMDNKR